MKNATLFKNFTQHFMANIKHNNDRNHFLMQRIFHFLKTQVPFKKFSKSAML